ncbi:hypothetical protein evm_003513 [Chilo suppressalis]|nr:hypothetical protein evm_003513 [Chilo suppressalis]
MIKRAKTDGCAGLIGVDQSDCRNITRHVTASESYAPDSIEQYPLGLTQVFSEAGDIFKKFISKMVANKKILGINSDWYI